jgi:uncharacterized phage protein (TIGR02218 family)
MRPIPDTLAARLGGATTLCHCWRLVLREGSRIGFTDHDRDISFDGLVHAAASGLEASEVETSLGFSAPGGEVAGVLMAAALTEADLSSGRYDGASIETWLVDWAQPAGRVLLDIGAIGEVSRSDSAFTAEVRSLAQSFDEPRGRLYQALCSADLGDARCRAALATTPFRVGCIVLAIEGASVLRLSVSAQASGWFSGGAAFVGARRLGTIRDHAERDGTNMITLWAGMAVTPAIGDMITLVAGCDKSFETCRTKFANERNFRGFPHMPGNDLMLSYIKAGEVGMDGGSLFR